MGNINFKGFLALLLVGFSFFIGDLTKLPSNPGLPNSSSSESGEEGGPTSRLEFDWLRLKSPHSRIRYTSQHIEHFAINWAWARGEHTNRSAGCSIFLRKGCFRSKEIRTLWNAPAPAQGILCSADSLPLVVFCSRIGSRLLISAFLTMLRVPSTPFTVMGMRLQKFQYTSCWLELT